MGITLTPFVEYLLEDVFPAAGFDNVEVKRMFGSYGFYVDGKIFGSIMDEDTLFLKARDQLAEDLLDAGGQQFVYTGHKTKGPTHMPYYSLPEQSLESPDELRALIERSLQIV